MYIVIARIGIPIRPSNTEIAIVIVILCILVSWEWQLSKSSHVTNLYNLINSYVYGDW